MEGIWKCLTYSIVVYKNIFSQSTSLIKQILMTHVRVSAVTDFFQIFDDQWRSPGWSWLVDSDSTVASIARNWSIFNAILIIIYDGFDERFDLKPPRNGLREQFDRQKSKQHKQNTRTNNPLSFIQRRYEKKLRTIVFILLVRNLAFIYSLLTKQVIHILNEWFHFKNKEPFLE